MTVTARLPPANTSPSLSPSLHSLVTAGRSYHASPLPPSITSHASHTPGRQRAPPASQTGSPEPHSPFPVFTTAAFYQENPLFQANGWRDEQYMSVYSLQLVYFYFPGNFSSRPSPLM